MNQPGNKCEYKREGADNLTQAKKGVDFVSKKYFFGHVTCAKYYCQGREQNTLTPDFWVGHIKLHARRNASAPSGGGGCIRPFALKTLA